MKDRDINKFLENRGVTLGNTRDPFDKVRELFLQYGIVVHPQTLTHIRTNPELGQDTMVRFECAEMLVKGKAEGLYNYYQSLIEVGLNARQMQKAWPWRYNSNGLIAAIANELDIRANQTRGLFRSLRAEIVLEAELDPAINGLLHESAENFFAAYTDPDLNPPSLIAQSVVDIMQEWDGSVKGFYEIFYRNSTNGPSVAKFLAYELEFFHKYINYQKANGSHLPQLAKQVMLIQVLDEDVDKAKRSLYINNIVPLDDNLLNTYLSTVLDGTL